MFSSAAEAKKSTAGSLVEPTQGLRHLRVPPAASTLPQSTCTTASLHCRLERSPHPCQRACRPHLWDMGYKRRVRITTGVHTNVGTETPGFVRKHATSEPVWCKECVQARLTSENAYLVCHRSSATSIRSVSVYGVKRAYTLEPTS